MRLTIVRYGSSIGRSSSTKLSPGMIIGSSFDPHRQRFVACRALRGQRFPNMELPATSLANDRIAWLIPAP